jgi:uncharacterized membrane-anchored protein
LQPLRPVRRVAELGSLGHSHAMTPEEYKHGRGSFWVQFTCGAVLGIFFGVPLARRFGDSFITGALVFLAVVGVCALASGFWGDRLWEALIRIWGWTGRR